MSVLSVSSQAAASRGDTDSTAHSTVVEVVMCIMSSVLHRFQIPLNLEWSYDLLVLTVYTGMKLKHGSKQCVMDNIQYAV